MIDLLLVAGLAFYGLGFWALGWAAGYREGTYDGARGLARRGWRGP